MTSLAHRVRPTTWWTAISDDVPPEIYDVGPYKEHLQSNLRTIRVRITPIRKKKREAGR